MTVTITPDAPVGPATQWKPEVGAFTEKFVKARTSGEKAIPGPAMDTVLTEAKSILGRCVSPDAQEGQSVVLVVGYVQSGKTLSFTTLASLARDNGFGLVILLAGTTNDLKGQSQERLEKDLGMERLQRGWTEIFENPDTSGPSLPKMRAALKSWRRRQAGASKEEKPALVISVLKQAGRISSAAQALSKLDLDGVPALIIDDESDQASPNTKARKNRSSGSEDESSTYASLQELRNALPHHSLVQYTATPQANLLLAATDRLNPDYAKVLSSGSGYTGGRVFFQDRVAELVRVVPDTESYDPKNPLTEPPIGLQEALRIFLLGIADASIKEVEENRSMMVQAHQYTKPHQVYRKWIVAMLSDWQMGLEAGGAYAAEVREEFKPAYDELRKTVPGLAPLEMLLENVPERAEEVRVVEVNSTPQAEKKLKWKSAFNWIVIGGQKLDRGFTVEGLTVTYMPRPISGNADVLQQRARFFGYRKDYIDYCRVYLVRSAREAFVDYVDDEEFLRSSLKAHEGKPLALWKRDFILHSQFNQPTRVGVVGRRISKKRLGREWMWPKSMHVGEAVRKANANLFQHTLSELRPNAIDADQLTGVVDRRVNSPRHLAVTGVDLKNAIEFLAQIRAVSRDDSLLLNTVSIRLARILRDPRPTDPSAATFVFLSGLSVAGGNGRQLRVVRETLHTGMNPQGATGSSVIYSGDASLRSADELTVQLRMLHLSDTPPPGEDYDAVPWVAISLPSRSLNHDLFLDLD
ncbi:Z1 domain-containing protein [Microbacterium foliorum]|uniref:Z1 domain-containing protein n=1 Tax=Microbacterium foliorum TaxID=104336 RepID=UPI00099F4C91|nr:Z1 domain-containing protein [Microbacterium foliorum]AQY00235.1 hypothetical protein B2G67_01085 [Microbacterium foliorum]